MKARLKAFVRDQRGAAMIAVAIALVMIFGFAVIAIDVGMGALVRTQLQNAADAAALAGVLAWAQSADSSLGIASAIDFAGRNNAIIADPSGDHNTVGSVDITASDIDFPDYNRLRVTTHRTVAKNDPFRTNFLRVLDPGGEWAEMTAKAAAGYFWVCGSDCPRPWAPPDRWCDSAGTGDCFSGNGVYEPELGEFYDPDATGYKAPADIGLQVVLRLGQSIQNYGMMWYFPVDFPPINKCGGEGGCPVTGGDQYRAWIASCADPQVLVEPGDELQFEPGGMTGPTDQGIEALLAQDPTAEWDPVTKDVINSAFNVSPRIVKMAVFDPDIGILQNGGRRSVIVAKIVVMFIEGCVGGSCNQGEVIGRFMRQNSPGGEVCTDQYDPTFLYKTALLE